MLVKPLKNKEIAQSANRRTEPGKTKSWIRRFCSKVKARFSKNEARSLPDTVPLNTPKYPDKFSESKARDYLLREIEFLEKTLMVPYYYRYSTERLYSDIELFKRVLEKGTSSEIIEAAKKMYNIMSSHPLAAA